MLQFPINRTAFVCKIGKTCLQLTTRLISENYAKGMPDKIYLKALFKKRGGKKEKLECIPNCCCPKNIYLKIIKNIKINVYPSVSVTLSN